MRQGHAIASDRRAKADGFNARSGDVGRYVNVADISMMPSVTDLAGLNNISRTVLRKAAFGIVGMPSAGPAAGIGKPPIALTMVGSTTPSSPLSPSNSGTASIASYFMQPEPVDARWKNSPTAPSSMA
jgi:hypothetical protein